MEAGAHPAEPIICLDDLQSKEAMLHPLEQAVETVVEAFVESEPVRFFARPGHEREYMRVLLAMLRSELQYEVHESGDFGSKLRVAAEEGSLDALLALGVPRLQAELVLHTRPERLRESRQMDQGLDALMEQHAQEHGPLLHLHFLATRAGEQGQGRGCQLLHHLERMADAEGRRLYLEATSPANRRLYLRHGFQDVGEFRVGNEGDSLTFYLMIRPPGARSLPPSAADLQAAAEEPAEAAAGGEAVARGKGAAGAGQPVAAAAGEGTLLRDEM
ncbi:GNAT family N-acetyltransferase [Chlorella sorokiniana]|uniref:GNAT family N-acetyltransferase n=1 Tax=Chlorella sorokiniana TaxID=3076 RepID=A0A2P6TUB2_CHLSO|nr:GNAT family N-acetyltransferase [Chlorella sorokiniana]|eukprot:PRW57650.1 GNAT family N-acetyltransferase [Chlorella sorokiniana]